MRSSSNASPNLKLNPENLNQKVQNTVSVSGVSFAALQTSEPSPTSPLQVLCSCFDDFYFSIPLRCFPSDSWFQQIGAFINCLDRTAMQVVRFVPVLARSANFRALG